MSTASLPRLEVGPPDSPLALFVRDQRTNTLLSEIAAHLQELCEADEQGAPRPKLVLSRSEVAYAHQQWEQVVLRGEARLFNLATLLAQGLIGTERFQLVARVVAGPREEDEGDLNRRIVIEETLPRDRLTQLTDYGLAASIVGRYAHKTADGEYRRLYVRASFLELRPLATSGRSLATRVITRVKGNYRLWNKVCDALFAVDHLVARDKILNRRSKFIKDVFGIKLLTTGRGQAYEIEDLLDDIEFSPSMLRELGANEAATRLEVVERKNYLASRAKASGWEAIKNVYRWDGDLFEVQIQPESNYFLEMSDLSSTSHRTFKMHRRLLRYELEKRLPHYRELRKLLRAIFASHEGEAELSSFDWVELAD